MKRLVLIDGHSLLYRAYHALPKTFTDPKGRPVNAVYGFLSMLFKVVTDLKPDFLAVAFDEKGPTFRHAYLVTYKEGRPEPEEDFVAQNPILREVLSAFKIPVYSISGYEGEDIIATIINKLTIDNAQLTNKEKEKTKNSQFSIANSQLEIFIVSGDRDVLQLIDDKVKVYSPKKGLSEPIIYDEENVTQVFGVKAAQIPDYKGLRGDLSDRIPGVFGIGEKSAKDLINRFGSVEKIYKKLDEVKIEFGDTVSKKLMEGAEQAVLSRDLAQIQTDAPLTLALTDLKFNGLENREGLLKIKELGFKSLLKRFGHEDLVSVEEPARKRSKKNPSPSEAQPTLL
ncbi:MAG: hypothetical protein M1352_01835 [Patescibacteria group bacterium]|nr:hypothetical protein [Patescibacteria group bacterium]